MYHVRQVNFGYVLTLEGAVEAADLQNWYQDTRNHLRERDGSFGVLVDARRCDPLSKGARFWLLRGQSVCEEAGLERAAVLVDSATQEGYWPKLAAAPPAQRVRFVDARRHYPEVRALSWIVKGVDPRMHEGRATPHPTASAPTPDERAIVEATGLPR